MKCECQLIIINFWLLVSSSVISQFFLYDTDHHKQFSHGRHDCLYYYVEYDRSIVSLPESYFTPMRQFIDYCLSSIDEQNNHSLDSNNVQYTLIKFTELKNRTVSSDDLLAWLAPVDLIERYQIYLANPDNISNELLISETFYNCPSPNFGPYCEYSFDFDEHSFNRVMQNTFDSKNNAYDIIKSLNSTCYKHLACDMGPLPLCLDWREVCDGKIDCSDGIDEKDCWKLEINDECDKEKEYRCHNGAQCIPIQFLFDNPLNPDCLDGSDESLARSGLAFGFDKNYVFTKYCYLDASFRCEERSCQHTRDFACGDGDCIDLPVPSVVFRCENERDLMFRNVLLDYKLHSSKFKQECWVSMLCMTQLGTPINGECPDIDNTLSIIQEECPKPYFVYPFYPLMYGHVFFVYKANRSELGYSSMPDFICYDSRRCPFANSSTMINIHNSLCQKVEELDIYIDELLFYWIQLTLKVKQLFGVCSTMVDDKLMICPLNKTETLFQCDHKCISVQRLADGDGDCYQYKDELFNDTCALSHSHYRFNCSRYERSDTSRCISPIAVLDGLKNCRNGADEESREHRIQRQQAPPYSRFCDTYIDVPALYIDEHHPSENDETNCDMNIWPCNNLYTRCDDVWNCENGADEIDCESNIHCRSYSGHPCISPINNTLFCLPLKYAGDGKLHCRGGADERHMCRRQELYSPVLRYHCWNQLECVSPDYLCAEPFQNFCSFDIKFCTIYANDTDFLQSDRGFCDRQWESRQTPAEAHLCSLKEKFNTVVLVNRAQLPLKLSKMETKIQLRETHQQIRQSKVVRVINSTSMIDKGWYCNRGILIYINKSKKCLCPPSYYGSRCENQNQRVSLTLQFRKEVAVIGRNLFRFMIFLIDENHHINSYDHQLYIPTEDCDIKYNTYLLYDSHSKNAERNYSVHIDAYDLTDGSVQYYASWILSFPFQFLPVNRIATQLIIPSVTSLECNALNCGVHGHCLTYVNEPTISFCRCDPGWTGSQCDTSYNCDCAKEALCAGPGSVCVCPFERFGSRCYLPRNVCQSPNICANGGRCVPHDERQNLYSFTCLCTEGFSGLQCQDRQARISISFDYQISIPDSILAHFIEADGESDHVRTTTFKKIAYDQNTVTLYRTNPFHILFIEFKNNYYLYIVQERFEPASNYSGQIRLSDRCKSIDELFNTTFVRLHLLLRVKRYHIPCRELLQLRCFYDDTYMCLCTDEHHANCFSFDHNMTYNCRGYNYCENNGRCFEDDPACPKTSMCVCDECSYGSKCQFSTKGFGLSLDAILGYQIKPFIVFPRQPAAVKISTAVTLLMFVVGILSGIASTITFQAKSSRKVGCGLYLLASSITSLLTMTMLALKFLLLLLAQMAIIIDHSFLLSQCIVLDGTLKILLASGDWFNACVAVERVISIIKGVKYEKTKSKRIAKFIIPSVFIIILLSLIHDPIHRQLITDKEEQRTWCVVIYSSNLQTYNSIINIFHFIVPFGINFVSAFAIIIAAAVRQLAIKGNHTYTQHLRAQFQEHRHLLMSHIILVILTVPRLVISFVSGCMKSARDPWIFLVSYFISFIPPMLIFVVFVMPSELYKKEIGKVIKNMKIRIQQRIRI